MRAKYGIQNYDFYNFNKTKFMMSVIYFNIIITRFDRCEKNKQV